MSVALVGLAALATFLVPGASAQMEYSRVAIAAGEWWRLLTGHLAHFTSDHLLWDVLTMIVLGGIVANRSITRFWWTLLGGAMLISLSLLLWMPTITIYRGLSGVDSALFACAAMFVLRESMGERARWKGLIAGLAIAGFLGKTLYELLTGHVIFVQDLGTGVAPVVMAHLVGAAWGIAVGMASWPKFEKRLYARSLALGKPAADGSSSQILPATVYCLRRKSFLDREFNERLGIRAGAGQD